MRLLFLFTILAHVYTAATAATQAPQLEGVPQKISAGQTMNLTWTGGSSNSVSLALVEGSSKLPIGIIAGNVTGGAFDWTIDSGIADANDYYIQLAQDTLFSYSDEFAITGATIAAATVSADESQPTATPSNSPAASSASASSSSSAASSTTALVAVGSSSPSSAASSAVAAPPSSSASVPSATAAAQSLNGTALQATSGGNGTETLVGGHVHLTTGGIVGIVIGVIAILIGISTMGIFALVLKMLKKHGPPGASGNDDVEELSSLGPARSVNHGPGGGPTVYPKRTNSADSGSSGVLGRGELNGNPTRPYDELGSPETLVARRVGDEDISLVPSAVGSGRVSPNDRYAAAAGAAHPGQQVQINGTGSAPEHGNRSPTSTYENNGGIMSSGFVPGEYRYGGNVGGYENGDTNGSLVPPPLHRPGTADSGRTLAYGEGGRSLMGGTSPPGGSRLRNQV